MAEKSQTKAAAAMADDKTRAIETAMHQIERTYGKGSIMSFGDNTVSNVEAISTGSLALDLALGIGGLPKGRIIEIYGPESSGKTTLALHVLAQAQKAGGEVAFIDAEHALDITYARALGVKVEDMLVSQPDTGEQALEITEALVPRAEIEGEMGDSFVGLHARLMSQAMRKLTGVISKTRTCCIFINQIREKIGVTFGNPEVTTGGNALRFYSSVRIEIRPSSVIKKDDTPIGRLAKVKVVKNKVAPPFMKAEFDIMFGEGISRSGEIVDLGVDYGVLKKSGAWFSYNGSKLGQGRDAVKNVIAENPELAEELSKLIIAKMNEARDAKRKPGNPFLPNPDAKRVEEDIEREDESLLDREAADSDAPEDLFGDDFDDIDIGK